MRSAHKNRFCFYVSVVKHPERKLRKAFPFIKGSKGIKCLRINLTKEVKDLYIEN